MLYEEKLHLIKKSFDIKDVWLPKSQRKNSTLK